MSPSFGQRCITAMWVFVSHAANSMKPAFHYASCGLRFLICVVATAWFLLHGGIAHAYGGWYSSTSAELAACQADLATFLPTRPASYCAGPSGSSNIQCAPSPKGPQTYTVLNVCIDSWHFCGGGWAYTACQNGIQCPTGQTYNFEAQQCQAEKDNDNKCDTRVSNPCNAATGNKHQEEDDFRAGNGVPQLTRDYNSLLKRSLAFGANWTSSFHRRLEIQGDSATKLLVQIRQSSGRGEPFSCTNNSCIGDSDSVLSLSQDSSGFTLTHRDKSAERYDLSGKLLTETDNTGRTTTYGYDSNSRLATVTGPFGHTLTLGYDASNHVSTVTDLAGQIIRYSYDINNNLTRVDYPDTTAKLYHYNETGLTSGANLPNNLTGISYVDSTGAVTRYATYAYDATGKAIRTEHAQTDNGSAQEKFTLAYDVPALNQTTVTDPVNMQEVMTFSTNLGVKNLVNKVNQSDSKSVQQTFDANNNLTCRKDEENRVTLYSYNSTNQRTSMTEGLSGTDCSTCLVNPANCNVGGVGRVTTYDYPSPTLDLPRFIRRPSVASGQTLETEIQYGDAGHPNLPTQVIQRGHTPTGTAVSRTVTLGYNAYGQVNRIDGPRTDVTDVTTLEYYECATGGACGQLKKVTNALGHITTHDFYDANGRLLQMTDPNGLRTSYTYDERGRVKTVTQTPTSGPAALTQYSYTPWGEVSQVIDPDGVVLTYGYDAAHYLRTITDLAGNQIRYKYDLKGNRTQDYTYDPSGVLTRTVSASYDLRNHPNTSTLANDTTQLVYDAVGNITRETDPNNHTTTHTPDALNRLMSSLDALNGTTGYGYDVNDRPTTVTAPNNLGTTYSYDDLGNLLSEASPDRNTTTYTEDAAGNILTVTDARGIITTYTYDTLNRVASGQSSDASTPGYTYIYDSCFRGRLCNVSQNGMSHLLLSYDGLGRLNYQLDLSTFFYSTYTYTPGGRLTRIIYPNNRKVNYQYDFQNAGAPKTGNIVQVSTASGGGVTTTLASNFTYYPFGPVSGFTFGNGQPYQMSFDQAYRPTSQRSGPRAKTAAYYPAGNLQSLTDTGSTQTFTYDALDELASATDTQAGSYGNLSYLYKPNGNGNRKSETRNGVSTSYVYYAGTNQLYHAGNDWRLMDAAGNTIWSSNAYVMAYDGYGRLTSAQSGAAGYEYNAFNQRTRKSAGGATASFYYGPSGELLYETGSGNKVYVYLHGMPLARVDGAQVYYYHTDHLGAPLMMTNSTGATVWKASYEPFGRATVNEDPDGNGILVKNNVGLPGMYRDMETGYYYVWHRFYDPGSGRWISSDPIGLAGGLNTYAYVSSNPLRFTDPWGLWSPGGHDYVLDKGFPNIPPHLLAEMKAGSRLADSVWLGYQNPENSFIHAQSSAVLDPKTSCEKLNQFVKRYTDLHKLKIQQASNFRARGQQAWADMYERDAFNTLGFALHPVMDLTPPPHEGFQFWRLRDFYKHGDFWSSQEDLSHLLRHPETVQKTINLMHRTMRTGTVCDCGNK